jgi:hypothetical protein
MEHENAVWLQFGHPAVYYVMCGKFSRCFSKYVECAVWQSWGLR